jgi:hypothetical protein
MGKRISLRAVTSLLNDRPTRCVFIDRVLRSMLERDGFDVHDIAERLIGHGWYYDQQVSDAKMAWEEVGDDLFFLIEEDPETAVMSVSRPLGAGYYDGTSLWLRERLPQTMCLSMMGRRLGEVIATGIPALDNRFVVEASTCDDVDLARIKETRVMLAADLVQLGTRIE